MPIDPKVLNRVRGLLAQAEGTDNPHEAELFSAHAAKLIDQYRIDAAQLAGATGAPVFGQVGYSLAGRKNLRASLALLATVATHYGVVVLTPSTGNSKAPTLAGTQDDVQAVVLLFESLCIQRDRAVLAETVPAGVATVTFRASFAYGYAGRIGERLEAMRRSQVDDATASGNSTALVLFDRKALVSRWLQDEHGIGGSVKRNGPRLDLGGILAGDRAARNADLGGTRVERGDTRLALGTGT